MHCPKCNQHYDGGKFCSNCGEPLVEDVPSTEGIAINLGDANAISGGVHLSDSHNVHNEDHSIHNITNIAVQKTDSELLQERKTIYLNACKRAYEDNVLEQHEVLELEELRIKLNLNKSTSDAILDSVRRLSERNARKSTLNPIAKTKLKILTENLQKNEVKALMDQLNSLEPLVRKFDHDELSRKYFLVLAALNSERCIELYETSMVDSYWKSFWSYLAYIKLGQLSNAENLLFSLDRFTDYPEDNINVLAVAGALMTGNTFEANEYLCELIGEYTPALQRFVDSLYLLLEPNTAKEMGANENTCAFYLVNFFGQKDPKAKAEEERQRQFADDREVQGLNPKSTVEHHDIIKDEIKVYDIHLKSSGPNKAGVIDIISTATLLGIADVRKMVYSTPSTFYLKLDRTKAEEILKELKSAGAQVELLEDILCDVVLKSAGSDKADVIKLVKDITHKGLNAAQEMVDNPPSIIKKAANKEVALDLKSCFEQLGAEVEFVKHMSEINVRAEDERKKKEEAEKKRIEEQERKKQEAAKRQALQDEETLRKEFTTFKILLNGVGPNPIKVKLAASDFVSISEAENLVDSAPCIFISNIKFKKAKKIKSALEEAGAIVVIDGDAKAPSSSISSVLSSMSNEELEKGAMEMFLKSLGNT